MNHLIPVFFVAAVTIIYSAAAARQIAQGRSWSLWRLTSFWCGAALIVLAFTPFHPHDHHTFHHHMIQHLLIGMLAPTFLVMAAPVSLVLRSLPNRVARSLVRFLHTGIMRVWCHPITALILNFGGMFVLYLTPLYLMSLDRPWLHHFIHLHFLLAGYLFAWSLIGPDPAPARPGFRARVWILFTAMACHGIFSKFMYIHVFPHNAPHSIDDIRSAAQLMYYGGDFAEILLAILLFANWRRRARSPGTVGASAI